MTNASHSTLVSDSFIDQLEVVCNVSINVGEGVTLSIAFQTNFGSSFTLNALEDLEVQPRPSPSVLVAPKSFVRALVI